MITKLMPADSQYVVSSQKQLTQFLNLSVRKEKVKAMEKGGAQREIG